MRADDIRGVVKSRAVDPRPSGGLGGSVQAYPVVREVDRREHEILSEEGMWDDG